MTTMTTERYIGILRIATIFVAFGMWVLSIKFSVDGFNFNLSTDWSSFAGTFLGLSVTVVQLVWNREANSNWTIMIAGMLAYAYGIYTNIEGILAAQGIQFTFTTTMVFPILLGLFIEVMPEALLVYGLTGMADLGDFFGNIIGGEVKKVPPKQHQNGREQVGKTQQQQKQNNKAQEQRHQPLVIDGNQQHPQFNNHHGRQPQNR